jgi:nitric oxide reductase NorD protein
MGLELDEIIFTKVLKYFKNKKRNTTEILSKKVELCDVKPRLTLIARAICGTAIDIFPAEKEGGYKDNNFFLPQCCYLFPTPYQNQRFYLFRTLYLCVQKQLDLNWKSHENSEELSYEKANETAPLVLENLFKDFPILEEDYQYFMMHIPLDKKTEIPQTNWLYGKWMKNSKEQKDPSELQNFDDRTLKANHALNPETTLQAQGVEEIESLTIDKKQYEENILMHNFEKIESAEEFNGNWRDFDGKDDLKDHQDAIEEMKMKYTVRVDDAVHSVYQADFVENTSVAESAEVDEKGFHLKYDEWNFKKRRYQSNFCKVYPKTQVKSNTAYYQKTMAKYKTTLVGLRKMLTSVNNRMQQQRRQVQGENFDLDALTDLYTDIHTKITPDERVYLSQRKKE